MFCQKCGNKMPENAKFCPICGTPASLKKVEILSHKKRRRYIILSAIVSILIVFILSLIILNLKREIDRKNYDEYVQTGKVYIQQGNYAAAVEVYEKALEIDNSDINIYSDMLTAYLALNCPNDAYSIVEESVNNIGDTSLKDSYIYYVYQSILDEYQNAMDNGEEFVDEHPEQFPHIVKSILEIYWNPEEEFSDGVTIAYYLTDIDKNGMDELAIGISYGTQGYIIDLYAFDGKSAVKLCNTEKYVNDLETQPTAMMIVDNIIVEVKWYVNVKDSGIMNIYRLDTDGFTPVMLKEFQFDYWTAFDGRGQFYDGNKYYSMGDDFLDELKEIGINIELYEKNVYNEEAYASSVKNYMIPINQSIWEEKEKQEQKDIAASPEVPEDTDNDDSQVGSRIANGYVYQDTVYWYKREDQNSFSILAFDDTGIGRVIEENIHTAYSTDGSYGIIGEGENLYWMETEESTRTLKGRIMKKNLNTGEKQEIIETEGLVGISGILSENLYYTTYIDKINWIEIELWELNQSTDNKRQIAAASIHPDTDTFEGFSVYDKDTCLVRAQNDNAELSYFSVKLNNGEMQELDISHPVYDNGIIYANRKNTDEIISIDMLTGKSEVYGIQGQLCCVSDNYIIVQEDKLNELKRFNKETGDIFSLKLQDETLINNVDNPKIVKQWNVNRVSSIDNDLLEFCFFELGEDTSSPYSFEGKYLINPANDNVYIFYGNEVPDNYFTKTSHT